MLVQRLLALCLASACLSAAAQIPSSYRPVVIEPRMSLSARVVDLTPAIEQARLDGMPLYIYLGAQDCPPCREYTRFLQSNREALKTAFDRFTVVDIRTWLRGPPLVFKAGDERDTVAEFKAQVGDTSKALRYPSHWLVTAQLRQLKRLPPTGIYDTVDQQLDALRLPDGQ